MLEEELERVSAMVKENTRKQWERMSPQAVLRLISNENTARSCWVMINGNVYDLTSYIASGKHPQGNTSILEWAGTDASEQFNLVHPPSILSHLPASALLGQVQ